jgi:hypothetical protein
MARCAGSGAVVCFPGLALTILHSTQCESTDGWCESPLVGLQNDGTDLLRFKTPELALIAEIKKSHPENLMAKHFSDHYYFSLPEPKRKQLLMCCKSGYENPHSKIGVYAMRPDDYDDFMPYMDKVFLRNNQKNVTKTVNEQPKNPKK